MSMKSEEKCSFSLLFEANVLCVVFFLFFFVLFIQFFYDLFLSVLIIFSNSTIFFQIWLNFFGFWTFFKLIKKPILPNFVIFFQNLMNSFHNWWTFLKLNDFFSKLIIFLNPTNLFSNRDCFSLSLNIFEFTNFFIFIFSIVNGLPINQNRSNAIIVIKLQTNETARSSTRLPLWTGAQAGARER